LNQHAKRALVLGCYRSFDELSERLTHGRFLQITVALHPEQGESEVDDKCHQLHAAIQYLNQHAKRAFVLGRHYSFDELSERLTYSQCLQIRAALHPEQGESKIGDKCHQLHAAIQYLNQHAKRAFVLGCHSSFDQLSERLTHGRFLQIRVALHPEQGESEIGDKCHQFHAAIQYLNQHAKRAFVLGPWLSLYL
jgi:fatty acid-binding protein DegV